MNFKTTGLLVALLAIIVAAWAFYPKTAEPTESAVPVPKAREETQALLSPAPESKSIVRVAVERPGKPRLVFTRAPKADQPDQMENWQAVEPAAVAVQTYTVDSLVTTLTGLQSRAAFESGSGGVSDADAGLAPAVAIVTLTDKNGKEYKFDVGQKAAMSTDNYVRLAGDNKIHIVVANDLAAQVRKEFSEYRDKKVLSLVPTNVVGLALQVEGKPYELTRGTDGGWVLDAPVKAHADREQVLDLVRKLTGLRVQNFLEAPSTDPTMYGLDRPYLTANITSESKKTILPPVDETSTQPAAPKMETVTEKLAVVIGGFADLKHENRYVKLGDQDWVATIAQKDIAPLVPDMSKLRDARVTRVQANAATKLSLSAEGLTAMLEKVSGRWQGQGDLADLDLAAVTELLQAFEDLRAIDFIDDPADLAEYGLAAPRAVVSVTVGGNVEPVALRIGNPTKSGRNAYVQREGQPTVFVVSAPQAYKMVVPPLSLRSRKIFAGDETRIDRLVIERGGARYELAREGADWKPAQGLELPLDDGQVRAIANDLAHLRARKVVARGDEARYGLDKPELTIRFAATEPPKPTTQAAEPQAGPAEETRTEHTLRVSHRENATYAMLDSDPYVYELDDTVYRVLAAELIDRKLFPFAVDDVVGVSIVQPSGTLEFAKQGDQWVFTPEPFVKLAQDKVKEFVGAVGGLRAESYVQYRGGDFQGNGLFNAPLTATVKLKNGDVANIKLQQKAGDQGPLAGWVEQKCVFRLAPADYDMLVRTLDFYVQPETPKADASKAEPGATELGKPRPPRVPPKAPAGRQPGP